MVADLFLQQPAGLEPGLELDERDALGELREE